MNEQIDFVDLKNADRDTQAEAIRQLQEIVQRQDEQITRLFMERLDGGYMA